MSEPTLFSPITVGNRKLNHRIVQAPLTRLRNTEDGIPQAHCVEYYKQRATKNGLLIAEATHISPANNYPFAPGLYTDAQIEGWTRVVDAVHAKGAVIFSQLWHVGRAGATGAKNTVSASAIPISVKDDGEQESDVPRALTIEEIKSTIRDYADAAKNAMKAGVELHAAYGYLIDQFTSTSSNIRTDEYGGSIENRTRFALEVTDAVVEAVGSENVAVRLSPWSDFQDMKDDTPLETWSYLTQKLQDRHPDLAYLHFVEGRINGSNDVDAEPPESLDEFRKIWKGPFVYCGGYSRDKAIQVCEKMSNNLIAFGRAFVANPDLVERFRRDLPLNKYHRPTFYTQGTEGYTDYPFHSETVI